MQGINITPLMHAAAIDVCARVEIGPNMSGVEQVVKNDWMYLGLLAIRRLAQEKGAKIHSAASIGSGNGIVEIGILRKFHALRSLAVTDILPEILPTIRRNIEINRPANATDVLIEYSSGADCFPLKESVQLIYANLPLIMVNAASLGATHATTTLTDAARYMSLADSDHDVLRQWSFLSQLGFLLSAKEKLSPGGSIITLLGGRVPYDVIEMLFARAELRYRELSCAFKRQSNEEFIAEYAAYEKQEGVQFCFYDYEEASKIITREASVIMPDVIPLAGDALKQLITKACMCAGEAHYHIRRGRSVGHIAYSFEAFV